MEIISYVGSDAVARQKKSQRVKTYANLSLKRKSERPLAKEVTFSRSTVSVARQPQPVKRPSSSGMSPSAWVFMIFSILLILITVPYSVFKFRLHQDSHTGPLVLDSFFPEEISVLNGEMTRYALSRISEGEKSGENVLDEEGNILSSADLGFSDVVTYQNYRVKAGETIGSIRRKFSLANDGTLININKIENVRNLMEGQKLKIPSQDGIIHKVASGENLALIASKYNVSLEEILDVNDLSTDVLTPGSELFIPGAMMDEMEYRKSLGELFACPLAGKWYLSSPFGRRINPITGVGYSNHNGIDMAIASGSIIKSTMSGDVAYVGYSNVYGNYVILNHLNGYQSLYAHMTKALVKKGQKVGQGTTIGLVGSTGMSTGPHLHFTIYKNGKAIDPQSVLNIKKK